MNELTPETFAQICGILWFGGLIIVLLWLDALRKKDDD